MEGTKKTAAKKTAAKKKEAGSSTRRRSTTRSLEWVGTGKNRTLQWVTRQR